MSRRNLLTITERHQQAADGSAHLLRSLAWPGAPILDACAIHSDFGHLLVLTADGGLHGLSFDTGAHVRLSTVDFPNIKTDDPDGFFGGPRYRLHASPDGSHAAIVIDMGRHEIVVDTRSGAVTLRLDGGDYCEETVPFSACFLRHEGRNVFIHRTAWNRLECSDPVTGELLTSRHIASYESGGDRPAHYLDYFHGRLRPSPSDRQIFDDGWVWQPVSVPRVWSVSAWLVANPWESEDGTSIVDLDARDDWNTPACWIDERQFVMWGLATWDEDEFAEAGQGRGVRVFDVTERKQSSDGRWPMDIPAKVSDLFCDGARLYVATDVETTAWDVASRSQVAAWPGFTARLLDRARHTLLAFGPDAIHGLPLSRFAATET